MIYLREDAPQPLYVQLYEAIREQIVTGQLAMGSKLPSLRGLAEQLHVSRNTVEGAYQQLLAEGYVTSHSGSGYRVSDIDFSPLLQAPTSRAAERPQPMPATSEPASAGPVPSGTAPSEPIPQPDEPDAKRPATPFDFCYGDRTAGSFPSRTWLSLASKALADADNAASRYSDGAGIPRLRQIIAEQVRETRGVRCSARNVVIQPGTQSSLDSLLALFDASHDLVAMEDPGYDGARSVFENRRFGIVPIPTFTRRIGCTMGMEALRASGARLAFVTPSNQFPLGGVMPLETRIQVIDWARANEAYVIEDDYCREFNYVSAPIPSLQSLDVHGRVIYLGTLSKVLSPALRMSYLVLPDALLDRWHELFANRYCAVPWLMQKTLELFIDQGHWGSFVRKTVATCRRRRNLLLRSITDEMGDRVSVVGGSAGLHILLGTKDARTQRELIEAAADQGVRVYPTDQYWMGTGPRPLRSHVLVGFSSIEERHIPEGIVRLARAWFG